MKKKEKGLLGTFFNEQKFPKKLNEFLIGGLPN
jgi:hypothetical protein